MAKKIIQAPGIERVFQCPYCPRTGIGVIAVDLGKALETAKATKVPDSESDISDGDPTSIVLFAPDRAVGKPCEHIISLLIDVEVRSFRTKIEFESLLSRTGKIDHSWFAANDPENSFSEHLWTEVDGGDEPAFHPTSPFEIIPFERSRRVKGTPLRVWTSGTIFVAMEPSVFLEELRDGYDRSQKFCDENC